MKTTEKELKEHYQKVEKKVAEFKIDLASDNWYNMWHIHLDFNGISNGSKDERNKHFMYYRQMLEKTECEMMDSDKPFQAYIMIIESDGAIDCFNFHTENPKPNFPFKLDGFEWDCPLPEYISSVFDNDIFNIGRKMDDNGMYDYFIEKKGFGVSIIGN